MAGLTNKFYPDGIATQIKILPVQAVVATSIISTIPKGALSLTKYNLLSKQGLISNIPKESLLLTKYNPSSIALGTITGVVATIPKGQFLLSKYNISTTIGTTSNFRRTDVGVGPLSREERRLLRKYLGLEKEVIENGNEEKSSEKTSETSQKKQEVAKKIVSNITTKAREIPNYQLLRYNIINNHQTIKDLIELAIKEAEDKINSMIILDALKRLAEIENIERELFLAFKKEDEEESELLLLAHIHGIN